MEKEEFNRLEKAALQWFVDHYQEPNLTAQIRSAVFIERQWTKVGYYVYFDVPTNLTPVDVSIFYHENYPPDNTPPQNGWPINGPMIESEVIEFGAGTLLWGKDGFIHCIEMHGYGDSFNENVSDFKLSASGHSYLKA